MSVEAAAELRAPRRRRRRRLAWRASWRRWPSSLRARPSRSSRRWWKLRAAAGKCCWWGELWEREQSRALLQDFSRAVFPPEPESEPEPGKPGCAEAGNAVTAAATGPHRAPGAKAARVICSPLVFALCRSSSLAAREPRRRLREMLRDVRGRRREGAALVGVLVAESGAENAVAPGLQLLETLLRTVFGRQVGGPVQAAAFHPGSPASSLAVQQAACRALQAAGPGRPGEAEQGRAGCG